MEGMRSDLNDAQCLEMPSIDASGCSIMHDNDPFVEGIARHWVRALNVWLIDVH